MCTFAENIMYGDTKFPSYIRNRTDWKATYAVCNSCNYSHDGFLSLQHGGQYFYRTWRWSVGYFRFGSYFSADESGGGFWLFGWRRCFYFGIR